jgi:hypothetical protein
MLATALAAALLAFAATGCGGGGKSYPGAKPNVWLPTVCGAFTDVLQGLDASTARMRADLRGGKDVEVVKARFIVWLKDVEDVFGTPLAKIKAVGPPAIKEGPAVQHEVEAFFADMRASFTHARERAEQLSTSNIPAFDAGVNSIANDMDQELSAIDFDDLTGKYDDQIGDKAASEYPACQELDSIS